MLYTLPDGPLHGYAINTAIDELTGERLGPGSLYSARATATANLPNRTTS